MKLTNKFIVDFFSYKRPHGSDTEQQWIEQFILPALGEFWWQDAAGNIHYDNRQSGKHRTLFVSHTDTVHHDAGRQKVAIKDGMVGVANGDCLGADDGAGALVLLAMIEARVPAYYIFTRCEERGGVGAKHLAKEHAELLAEFDRAVAFDRRGTSSVISHQGWGRCCSDEFADALSDALSNDVLMYAPDDTGVYTDTAEFVSIIPECTNISVGYDNEHTKNESLDLAHLKALIACVTTIDWEALPVARDPAIDEDDVYGGWYKDVKFDMNWRMGGDDVTPMTDYNCEVYDALTDALDGDVDGLLYMVAQALDPADPDSVYEQIWNMPVPEYLITNAMRQVDYAQDDEQTARALIDLYQAVVYGEIYQ